MPEGGPDKGEAMNILFVTPEVFPFARAGGLGDVSHYLPMALAERGHHIWIITPKHRNTEEAGYQLIRQAGISAPLSWKERTADLYSTRLEGGIEVLFVGCDELYNRAGLYGNEFGDYEDNAERFIFFCKAVMESIRELDLRPDVIHCHDWSSGLIPVYAQTLYKDLENARRAATLFTFHNLGSQGIFWHYDYSMTGLDWEFFKPEGLEFHGQLNMTKAGLVFADLISTVSKKYAREVLTPDFAFGLEGVLDSRRQDLYAVLNGVDYSVWDPAEDEEIVFNYGPNSLEGKKKCKEDLARIFNLNISDQPILAIVSRLLDRKGFDIISAVYDRILEMDVGLVIMGMGEDKYHIMLGKLAERRIGRMGLKVAYDKGLAHKIMAGSDIFLMASRYEPCGLEQLYALKYGTIPVVRATGGLDDTVTDALREPEFGNGFKFEEYSPEALYSTLKAAVECFKDKEKWRKMMIRGMSLDFSWSRSAIEYEELYRRAALKARTR